MAIPARMMPADMIGSPGDPFLPPVIPDASSASVQPVSMWQSLGAWLATIGLLILLAAGTILAAIVWFFALFFAESHPDEAAGE